MAELIDKDSKIRNGHVVKVKNLNRPEFSNQSTEYFACYFCDIYNNEQCVLFTQGELNRIKKIELFGLNVDKGTLYPLVKNGKITYLTKLILNKNNEVYAEINKTILDSANKRAQKNIEDIPKKNALINMLDNYFKNI